MSHGTTATEISELAERWGQRLSDSTVLFGLSVEGAWDNPVSYGELAAWNGRGKHGDQVSEQRFRQVYSFDSHLGARGAIGSW